MDGPVARRTRSTRKSVGTTSSPAVAARRSTGGRDSPSVGFGGNKDTTADAATSHLPNNTTSSDYGGFSVAAGTTVSKQFVRYEQETPLHIRTTSAISSIRSRPSIASTSSSSTTGSKVFDTPATSPPCESIPTSPEEDAISPHDTRTPNSFWADSSRPKTNAHYKLSIPKNLPAPSIKVKAPVKGRRRSSSVPSVGSPTKPRPSSDDPVSSSSHDSIIEAVKKLSLEEGNAAKVSARSRRASSKATANLAPKHNSRASSAAGRMEERVTNGAEKGPETNEWNTSPYDEMDWEASPEAGGLKLAESLKPSLAAHTSNANLVTQRSSGTAPKVSSTRSKYRIIPTIGPSELDGTTLSVQHGAMENVVQHKVHRKLGREPSVDTRPIVMTEDAEELEPVQLSGHSGVEYGASNTHVVPEADGPIEAEDGSEANASLPEAEITPEAEVTPKEDEVQEPLIGPAANEEARYPKWKKVPPKVHTRKDIEKELIKIINPPVPKGGTVLPKDPARGYIYVYTTSACRKESGTASPPIYQYFKCGLTIMRTPVERIKEQEDCVPDIIIIEDEKDRQFKFAKLAEKLIQCELQGYRRQHACRNYKDGHAKDHKEWYEIEVQHLLNVVEKWRSWVTMSNPYTSKGLLRPRWIWKLALLEKGTEGVDLDHLLQPFTFQQRLSRQWDWIVHAWDSHFERYDNGHESRALMDLFLATAFIWAIFIYLFGGRLGSWLFVGSSALLLNYISWR